MREKISMKPKLLGALALLTMIGALFVMQSADQYTPTADAATGTIHALNVGTCLTTSADVFTKDKDGKVVDDKCANLDNDADDWQVRAKIAEVTYALRHLRSRPQRAGRCAKSNHH